MDWQQMVFRAVKPGDYLLGGECGSKRLSATRDKKLVWGNQYRCHQCIMPNTRQLKTTYIDVDAEYTFFVPLPLQADRGILARPVHEGTGAGTGASGCRHRCQQVPSPVPTGAVTGANGCGH
eukprot:1654705-Rhodomonas_salina.1